jgi:membrane protein involved in colicin uptake
MTNEEVTSNGEPVVVENSTAEKDAAALAKKARKKAAAKAKKEAAKAEASADGAEESNGNTENGGNVDVYKSDAKSVKIIRGEGRSRKSSGEGIETCREGR